ncbi:MAG: hypothetical protein QGH45_00995 [Myxococcota bacterium]|nr:hypothetical protein [Myxococcota bacterium]
MSLAVDRGLPWVPVGVALVAGLPFVGSALFLDDWIYLTGAQLMLDQPLSELHRLELPFLGEVVPAHAATHPFGAWAWLVPLLALGGGPTPTALLQLGSLAWLLALLVAVGPVARICGGSAGWVRWLLLAVPPLLLLAHRIMPDLPFTSLGALALACIAVAVHDDRPRNRWLAAAGVAALLSAAWLVAYQALALAAALALALPWIPRGRRSPLVLAVAFTGALFVAGQVYSSLVLGSYHLGVAGRWFSGSIDTTGFTHGYRLWAYLGYLGGFGAPALLLAIARAGVRERGVVAAAAVGATAGIVALVTGWSAGTGTHPLPIAAAVAVGGAEVALLGVAGVRGLRRRHALLLVVAGWGLGTFIGGWWLLPAPLSRYLLPVHLAVAVVAAAWPRGKTEHPIGVVPAAARGLALAGLAIWLVLSLGIAASDAARADATARLVERLPQPENGGHFIGESGFRLTAEERGMRYLTRYDQAQEARLLHADVGQVNAARLHPALHARLGDPVRTRQTYRAWVSAVDWDGGADFYFPFAGAIPFTFPGSGHVVAETYPVDPPLPDTVDRALACLAAGRSAAGTWPSYVRWEEDGDWTEVHSVFTTAEVLIALGQLPRRPAVTRLAEPALDALEADRNEDGSWSFYGRADRVGERAGRAWPITADADDTARAVLALRAWDRPIDPRTLVLLADQIEPDGTVRTWMMPPGQQVRTDSNRPDPVVAAAVARALLGTPHADAGGRVRDALLGRHGQNTPNKTTYYQGARRIGRELALAFGEDGEGPSWPPAEQGEDGCWPLQPTFFGAHEAGRPAYGSVAEPTAVGALTAFQETVN